VRFIFWPALFTLYQIERFCHWFQRLTGLTNYWWFSQAAWIITWTAAAGWMRSFYGLKPIWLTPTIGQGFWWGAFVGFIVSVYGYDAVKGWKQREARAFCRLSLGMANPIKNEPLALIFLTLLLFTFWVSLYSTGLALYFSFYACDPLPPCRGKIREWWAERHQQLVPVREEGN